MALLGALCVGLNALGSTNWSLRAHVSRLLGVAYTVNQMSYDLARLRLNKLIERRLRSNTYDWPADGQRVAIFYAKIHDRALPACVVAVGRFPGSPTGQTPRNLPTAGSAKGVWLVWPM